MRKSRYPNGRMLAATGCALFWMLPFVRIAAGEVRLNLRSAHLSEAPAAIPHYHFIAGKQLIYRVSYSGAAQTDFQVLLADKNQAANKSQPESSVRAQSFKTTMEGQLLLTVVKVKDHNIVLAYNLRNAVVK